MFGVCLFILGIAFLVGLISVCVEYEDDETRTTEYSRQKYTRWKDYDEE